MSIIPSMPPCSRETPEPSSTQPLPRCRPLAETAFGAPRNFLGNRFVYVVISSRARGLSVGVNMNPDKRCNFDCIYCEVNHSGPLEPRPLEVETMAGELEGTIESIQNCGLRSYPAYSSLPEELISMRHVTLSGDGEPTLTPEFAEAVQAVVHIRALGRFPFFKIVLLTNGTGLDLPRVEKGLHFLTRHDEIWVKLDAGTPEFYQRINRPQVPLEKVLENIILVGRQRPVVIQSLFVNAGGEEPSEEEIDAYTNRISELVRAGAQISLVQIYSATRPSYFNGCKHLSLRTLSRIARTVRQRTGLKVEVF